MYLALYYPEIIVHKINVVFPHNDADLFLKGGRRAHVVHVPDSDKVGGSFTDTPISRLAIVFARSDYEMSYPAFVVSFEGIYRGSFIF